MFIRGPDGFTKVPEDEIERDFRGGSEDDPLRTGGIESSRAGCIRRKGAAITASYHQPMVRPVLTLGHFVRRHSGLGRDVRRGLDG